TVRCATGLKQPLKPWSDGRGADTCLPAAKGGRREVSDDSSPVFDNLVPFRDDSGLIMTIRERTSEKSPKMLRYFSEIRSDFRKSASKQFILLLTEIACAVAKR